MSNASVSGSLVFALALAVAPACDARILDPEEGGLDDGGVAVDAPAQLDPVRAVSASYWIDPGGHPATVDVGTFSVGTQLSAPVQSANGVSEAEAFFRELHHADASPNDWSMRIGTGGQIYSIRTGLGELIGDQGGPSGEWMDRVFQTVAVDETAIAAGVPYFIQQGGAYRDPAITGSVPYYSPSLGSELDASGHVFHTLTWPQQSHLEVDQSDARYQSNYLLQQDIRDLGQGAVEITWVYTNFGVGTCDFIDLPWSGFRKSTLPVAVESRANGGWVWGDNDAGWTTHIYNIATTFGWIGFLAQQAVDSAGMSVVFARPNQQLTACSGGPAGCPTGSTCTPAGCALDAAVAACATATIEGQGCNTPLVSAGACVSGVCQPSLGVVRYGANPPEDLTVFEAIASRSHGAEAVLEPGATYYYRVFLVFDALSTGLHPRSNMLARHVSQGRLDFPLSDSGLLRTCDHIGGTTGIPCNWYTFDRPVPNARPLLLVRDHVTGALLYSTTPYALSFTPSNRRTDFVAMVGWVLPRTTTVAPDPRWRALSDLLDASQFPDPGAGRGDAWIVTTP